MLALRRDSYHQPMTIGVRHWSSIVTISGIQKPFSMATLRGGDRMKDARLFDGDRVIVDRVVESHDSSVVVA